MAVQDRLYTIDDLEQMPNDGKFYELHNGVLVEVAGSAKRQTRLAAWLIYLLTQFIEDHHLGGAVSGADGTFAFNQYNARIPDVAYVTAASDQSQTDAEGFFRGAPDLAIEVVPPSNTPLEMQQRAGEYLSAGSRLVWIVDPELRTVDVYRQGGQRQVYKIDDTLNGELVLPGLQLPVTRIFERTNS